MCGSFCVVPFCVVLGWSCVLLCLGCVGGVSCFVLLCFVVFCLGLLGSCVLCLHCVVVVLYCWFVL